MPKGQANKSEEIKETADTTADNSMDNVKDEPKTSSKKKFDVYDSNGKLVRTVNDKEKAEYLAKVYSGKVG